MDVNLFNNSLWHVHVEQLFPKLHRRVEVSVLEPLGKLVEEIFHLLFLFFNKFFFLLFNFLGLHQQFLLLIGNPVNVFNLDIFFRDDFLGYLGLLQLDGLQRPYEQ